MTFILYTKMIVIFYGFFTGYVIIMKIHCQYKIKAHGNSCDLSKTVTILVYLYFNVKPHTGSAGIKTKSIKT